MNPATALAALEQRISVMNEEDKVRNLQNAYGYYMDRKMWDDVTDLFTSDGALSIANVGVYDGPKSIRRALERSGPAGLKHGQLNELMQLDMAVAIEPGGMEARARGLEFGMLGEAGKGTAFYTLAIFENRYVKQNDIWRIREMRIFPLMKTDYAQGWAKSQVVDPPPAKEHAPDRPVLASDVMTPGAIPVFFAPNPATGKPVSLPSGAKTVGHERLLPAPAAHQAAAPSGDLDARLTEAERRLAVSKAWDGAENMSSAYGDYLDDLDFGGLGKLFAEKGHKEVPFSGFYVGRQRIIDRDATSPPPGSRPRATLPLHWRTQPVILVAEDGRSASIRSRLFQPGSSHTRAMGFGGGMYHDQVVLEDGVWKFWSVVDRRALLLVADLRRRLVRRRKDPVRPHARRPRGARTPLPAGHSAHQARRARAGFRGGTGDEIVLARHPADVVPLQEPRQRTRAREVLAGLRSVRAVPRDQHEEPRLPAAAVMMPRRSRCAWACWRQVGSPSWRRPTERRRAGHEPPRPSPSRSRAPSPWAARSSATPASRCTAITATSSTRFP